MPDKEIKLPTKEEIAKIPRWAIVAFAARCAKRVELLFASDWPGAPKSHKKAVAKAIKIAEKSAEQADALAVVTMDAFAANVADADATATFAAADAANAAAFAAADAANAAAFAAAAAFADADADAANAAAYAAAYAANTANADAYIRADFEKLKRAAKTKKWTNGTPVPPEFFGPLWPDGVPVWKKTIADVKRRKIRREKDKKNDSKRGLSVQVVVPDYVSEEQVVEELIGLFHALSEYHIALGGNGLTIEDFQTFIREGVLVGVEQ